jgi:hypothetical protein
MSRENQVRTLKLPVTVDENTDTVLTLLANLGLFGKNKSEVAVTIINRWLWDNYEQLEKHGVPLSKDAKSADSRPTKRGI